MELPNNIVPKSKIFVFGSCDVWDAVDISSIRREFDIDKYYYNDRPYDLDFSKGKLPIRSPSLLSLYTPPNSIANRVFDTMHSIRHRPPMIDHYWIYHEIVKFPYLKFYQENAGPNDILVCNFSAELYTKYVTSNEAFTIVPPMVKLLKNTNSPFSWLADGKVINGTIDNNKTSTTTNENKKTIVDADGKTINSVTDNYKTIVAANENKTTIVGADGKAINGTIDHNKK